MKFKQRLESTYRNLLHQVTKESPGEKRLDEIKRDPFRKKKVEVNF